MAFRNTVLTVWAAASICGLVACGSSQSPPPAASLDVNVTIAKGQVTPTNATLQAKVKQQIILHVTSDAADELHVHSVPDHKFEVAAAPNQTVSIPWSAISRRIRASTPGPGSINAVGWRTTR